jgi:HEAT repeat protein
MRSFLKSLIIVLILCFTNQNLFSKSDKKEPADKKTSQTSNENSPSKIALNTIVSHLKNSDSDVKAYAIEALSKTHNSKLIPIIKKYLDDPSKYVQISAVKAMWELGEVKYVSKLADIINDTPKENIYKNDPLTQIKIISQNKIREKAIESLVDLSGIKASKFLLELKENDNFPQIRDVASRELAKIGFKDELTNFYQALNSNDEEIRNQAAQDLIRICPDEAGEILIAIKKEKSIRVKILMIESLKCAKLNSKEEEDVIKFIDDENQTIRYKAISILVNSNSQKVLEKLKKVYEDTPDINIKLIVAKKLLKENLIKIEQSDIEYFNSINDSEVKRNFIGISSYIPELSLNYLINYLNDSNPYVQIDSAIQIIQMEKKK